MVFASRDADRGGIVLQRTLLVCLQKLEQSEVSSAESWSL